MTPAWQFAQDAFLSLLPISRAPPMPTHSLAKRDEPHDARFIVFACLIPVLVILSGIFAGLTLGYMSLDETQLNVLSMSGTPLQRKYAEKIKPIRKNGHLLLVTLLLANMITNETLPIIADPILGGGLVSVVVSTVLIVLFAEIIPQSICTRHGLYIGAKMAGVVRILILVFGVVAWPVAKLLELLLGPHHGIIYRRAELKELIAMHSSISPHGGDLRTDTVTIIGATLDLQEKVVRQAMTPISEVFMLSIDAKLDYDTLRQVCLTGHSRVPVYEEVEVDLPVSGAANSTLRQKTKVKRIIGILLVKQCVLLDPQDAVPVRKLRLNKVPFVPQNEPLLGILDRFQEGRSHIAIVSRISVERAQSVKSAVKQGLSQRLLGALSGDSDGDSVNGDEEETDDTSTKGSDKEIAKVNINEAKRGRKKKATKGDIEMGDVKAEAQRVTKSVFALEQRMPADAVLAKESAEEYLQAQGIDPAVMPLGIITLEDVLEELIGEEIYDEFDAEGAHSQSYEPPTEPDALAGTKLVRQGSAPDLMTYKSRISADPSMSPASGVMTPITSGDIAARPVLAMPRPVLPSLKSLGFLRSRSAPPTPRDGGSAPASALGTGAAGATTPRKSTEAPPEAVFPADTSPTVFVTSLEGETKALDLIVENPSPKSDVFPAAVAAVDHAPAHEARTPPPAGVAESVPHALPLEAILLTRGRRQHNASHTAAAPTVVGSKPGTPSGHKGKGFKSAPLNGGEASAGVVVAEQIRRELAMAGGSISHEKDKMGPDIVGENKE